MRRFDAGVLLFDLLGEQTNELVAFTDRHVHQLDV
jgi:hypothetical protein